MRKYITNENSGGQISVDFGREFGTIDIFRILNEIRESETLQYFGAKKGGSIISNLEIRNGILYFGACDGNFYAVDAETGGEVWRYPASDVILSFALGKDALYISCYDHNLHAVGFDGRLLWKFMADGRLGNVNYYNGMVYFGTDGGNLYCINEKGRMGWRFSTGSLIGARPVPHNGFVLFGDFHGKFYALDVNTGRLKWVFKANSGAGSCLVADGVIYFPVRNSIFYALNMEGKKLWRLVFAQGLCVEMAYEPPTKGLVFVSGLENNLYAILTETHQIAWTFKTRETANNALAIDDGVIYFGDCDNNFYAAELQTGRLIWKFRTGGINIGGVVVHNGKVYFGSWDCNAYCLDAKTGRLVWKFHTSMGNMSDYETDRRADKPELSIIVQPPEEVKKEAEKKEERLADYGEFSGSYIDKEKADYVKSGRKGYIKKKDF